MPSGKVHDSIAIISVLPVFLTGYFIFKFNFVNLAIFTVACLFSQLMFGPDLDSNTRQYKRWGLFRWLWLPYRLIIPHRSRFSHGLIFGPIFRFFYIIAMVIFLSIVLNQIIYLHIGSSLFFKLHILSNILNYQNLNHLIVFIIGIYIGAAIHTLTDKVFSFFNNLI